MADVAFINDTKDVPLDELLAEARAALNSFYGDKGNSTFQKMQASEKAAVEAKKKEVSAVDLSKSTDNELMELLKHRDETMKTKAILEIKARMDTNPEKKEKLRVMILASGLRPLVEALGTTNTVDLQIAILHLFVKILGDDLIQTIFRQAGALEPIAKMVLATNEEVLRNALVLMINLAIEEKNRDAFRRVSGIISTVVPMVGAANANVQRLAVKLLVNLSMAHKNQDVIARAGALEHVFQLLGSEDKALQFECLQLLQNLSYCATVKTSIKREQIEQMIQFVQPRALYTALATNPSAPERSQQLAVLTFFSELAKYENNQRELASLNFLRTLFVYFLPLTKSGAHFKFDHQVMYLVVLTIQSLVSESENRKLFLDNRGASFVIPYVERAADFPDPVSYVFEALQIVHTLVSAQGNTLLRVRGDVDLLSQIVTTVFRLFDLFGNADQVMELLCKVLKHIAATEQTKLVILQYGDVGRLCNVLRTTGVKEVISNACATLARLSTLHEVRVNYLYSLAPTLTAFLVNNDAELRLPIVQIFAALSKEQDGINTLFECPGCVPALVSVLETPNVEIQVQVLTSLSDLIFEAPKDSKDPNKRQLVTDGLLDPLLVLISSSSESIQVLALTLLNALATNDIIKEVLEELKVLDQLKALADHPNIKKENSNIVGTYKQLLAIFDSKNELAKSIQNLDDSEDPDVILDTLLDKLTHRQLVILVKMAIERGADLIGMITKYIEANLALETARSGAATEHREAVKAKASAAAPPAAKKGPAKKTAATSKAAGPVLRSNANSGASRMSVLDQIKAHLANPIALKHVNAAEEEEKRKRHRQAQLARNTGLLQSLAARAEQKKETRLLDSGVMEGRTYYLSDMNLYLEQCRKAFTVDKNFMKAVLMLLESASGVVHFEDAFKLASNKELAQQPFAEALGRVGFTLKHKTELIGDEGAMDAAKTVHSYTHIILPVSLPVKTLAKILLLVVQQAK